MNNFQFMQGFLAEQVKPEELDEFLGSIGVLAGRLAKT